MFTNFKSIPVPDTDLTLVQPPAGLLPYLNSKMKIYTNDEGKLDALVWNSLFVLMCLHKDSVPVVSLVTGLVPNVDDPNLPVTVSFPTIKDLYIKSTDDEFKAVVTEFLFNVDRDTLDTCYELIDENCLVSKKAADKVKND